MADSALGPALRPGDGVLGMDADQFIDVFCAGAPAGFARQALASLRPDPLVPLGTLITSRCAPLRMTELLPTRRTE